MARHVELEGSVVFVPGRAAGADGRVTVAFAERGPTVAVADLTVDRGGEV